MKVLFSKKFDLNLDCKFIGKRTDIQEVKNFFELLLLILVKKTFGDNINADLESISHDLPIPSCVYLDSGRLVLPVECKTGIYTLEFYMRRDLPLLFCDMYSRVEQSIACEGYSKPYMLTWFEPASNLLPIGRSRPSRDLDSTWQAHQRQKQRFTFLNPGDSFDYHAERVYWGFLALVHDLDMIGFSLEELNEYLRCKAIYLS
ncbi:hypothetical protein PCS_01978 [Desulfocurvibacter africanus PCS]|uniref:Uncharacterized protein n=1 Tax=Desulfocurvibacter africanus PCS TaxID=1262666 RepID=M5PRX6_DESAF|nr:hypothetical protein [Desulfocurvibacter africanus]EMG37142.1 hypothetical protein PCS_01978 [Desulfocurvibacter africanus PCS]